MITEHRSTMPSRLSKTLSGYIGRLGADQRGAVVAMIALAIMPLFAGLALAIDLGRGYLLKSKLSYAIDAAGLAGGRAFDSDRREDDIEMFFEANFPDGFMGAVLANNGPTVTFNDSDNTITIEAEAIMPTHFMTVAGVDTVTVATRTVIQREMRGMELALVMDNTGSMRSSGKMDAMKDAATELVDILYGDRETVPNFWVSLVPYAATVNIGSDHTDWLVQESFDTDAAWLAADPDSSDRFGYHPNHFQPTTWKGCVEARNYPYDSNDDLWGAEAWYPHLWRTTLNAFQNPDYDPDAEVYDEDDPSTWGEFLNGDNNWDPNGAQSALKEANNDQNNGTGPNLGCGPAITPLVAEKTTILDGIDEMLPWHRGGTMANLGAPSRRNGAAFGEGIAPKSCRSLMRRQACRRSSYYSQMGSINGMTGQVLNGRSMVKITFPACRATTNIREATTTISKLIGQVPTTQPTAGSTKNDLARRVIAVPRMRSTIGCLNSATR